MVCNRAYKNKELNAKRATISKEENLSGKFINKYNAANNRTKRTNTGENSICKIAITGDLNINRMHKKQIID